jgi:hypothetical protein
MDINFFTRSNPRKADKYSSYEEVPRCLWNTKVYYYFHKSPQSVPKSKNPKNVKRILVTFRNVMVFTSRNF